MMLGDRKKPCTDDALLFEKKIEEAKTIAISGHINPDGDCIGSCLGLRTYILDQYPEKQVDVYLDDVPDKFLFLKYADSVLQEKETGHPYDLFCSLDCSEPARLGIFASLYDEAKYQVCIDHHITNQGFGDLCFIRPDASSTCEILCSLFDYGRISIHCAEDLYLGIVHDTGVFKHSNTTRRVMEIAGALIDKGVKTEKIIDDTFYKKTYVQNQILGRALTESILILNGRMIFSILSQKDMKLYGVKISDLDGIIDQLRITDGVECALLLHENEKGQYKVSMRSNGKVDVSEIAAAFGGGGHMRAAGCTVSGEARDIINNIAVRAEHQLAQ